MLNKFKNTKAYIRNYTDKLISLLRQEIKRARTRTYRSGSSNYSSNYPIDDTGSLAESIKRLRVKNINKGFSYGIEANSYAIPLNEKKGKRKLPPVDSIISWIQRKRITLTDNGKPVSIQDIVKVKSIAYLISKSISVNNVKPTGFINSAIQKSISELNTLGAAVGKDVSLNLDDILVKAGYVKKGENYIIKKNE